MAVSTDLPRRASRTALPTGCQPFPSLAFSFLLLAMFLGPYAQGQHRFPIVPSYQTGGDAFKIVAVADFNKDGHEDALVLNFNYGTDPPSSFISLLLGDGHGGFGKPNTVLTNDVLPNQIRTGDFNGDGIPDIAVVTPANGTQVYLAKGDGTFHAASPTGALSNQSIELGPVGDFNGDGRLDLVVQDPANNRNLILLGKGNGNFSSSIASNVPAGSNYGPMVAGDFNQDGILD